MVLKYAHLASDHLAPYVERMSGLRLQARLENYVMHRDLRDVNLMGQPGCYPHRFELQLSFEFKQTRRDQSFHGPGISQVAT